MSTDGGTGEEDAAHVYNGLLLSHKENGIMSFAATEMDLKMIILSQSDRERQIS